MHLEDKITRLRVQQYAYRKNRSTVQAINDMISNIEENLDRKMTTWSGFFDVEGCFDQLEFNTITRAMRKIGIEAEIIAWVLAFLKHRRIISKVLNCTQTFTPLRGIPQGSLVACRLWIICMDELIELLTISGKVTALAYADDLTVASSSLDEMEAQRELGAALEIIDRWCTENSLNINRSKCEFMRFTRKRKNLLTPTICYKGEVVKFSSKIRYLGVMLDPKLNWAHHFREMKRKAMAYLFMLKKFSGRTWGFKISIMKRLYDTVIIPKILYAIPVWYHRTQLKTVSEYIERVHNSALRVLISAFPKTPAIAIETALGILP